MVRARCLFTANQCCGTQCHACQANCTELPARCSPASMGVCCPTGVDRLPCGRLSEPLEEVLYMLCRLHLKSHIPSLSSKFEESRCGRFHGRW